MTLDRAASDKLVHDSEGGLPRLLEIMARLRDPNTGCPWDIEQDFATIAPYTIEEAYEVADAIERGAWGELEGELGDLLFQTVYHAQMGSEAGHFSFESVTKAISDKMVARHPHVFGDESRDKSAEQQTRDWERLKAAERADKAERGTLDGVAVGLPALTRAVKLQNRAARVGFDWPSTDQVIDKITEEARELNEARGQMTETEVFEEFGDLLFVIANLARHMKIDPEAALRAANGKFTRRFRAIEAALAERGKRPEDSDLAEMDALWDAAKLREKAEAAQLHQPQRLEDPQRRMAEEQRKLAEKHRRQQQAQQQQ
ncbi:nucleoside triphosphate pyrophosphohydrolase [Defluviimonas aestuarii]|uniref:nucleoside triphosphate pyrophosphohydrolase n=1 Tax=Albidovulum aestuarii TaxID=1130726 RepID=UPI00249B57F2|nr:nucleoside triphosphate pyrophosphohydrolase [Defluviimonas aestuarii]MDI3334853.1 nucleoside triphosphate pyrophosphohydrolase [Defluviimonas aestuarii]